MGGVDSRPRTWRLPGLVGPPDCPLAKSLGVTALCHRLLYQDPGLRSGGVSSLPWTPRVLSRWVAGLPRC